MSQNLERRIDRLERVLPQSQCPTCSTFEWQTSTAFLVEGEIDAEDAVLSRPERCPSCGRYAPIYNVVGGGLTWDSI